MKYTMNHLEAKTDNHDKMIRCIRKSRLFNFLFNAGNKEKSLLYKSNKYGAIYTTEIQKLLEEEHPYFMISLKEIAEDQKKIDDFYDNYYAFATFMPPGENKIIVSYDDINEKESYNFLENIIPIRKGGIILHQKRTKMISSYRQFQKHLSVFKDWIPDTKVTLEKLFKLDIGYTKLRRFVRNCQAIKPKDKQEDENEEYEKVIAVLLENLDKIKEIYTHCIGVSSYPFISWLEF